jgi:hypothetical protein
LLACQLKNAWATWYKEMRCISISFDDINGAKAPNVVEQRLD